MSKKDPLTGGVYLRSNTNGQTPIDGMSPQVQKISRRV